MSERLRAVVDSLELAPGDRVLEIAAATVSPRRSSDREPERARGIVAPYLAPGGAIHAF